MGYVAAAFTHRTEARLGRTLTDDERAEQYQFATYDTRPPKTGHAEDETTRGGRWRTEAAAAGWEPEMWLPATLWRAQERPLILSVEVEPGVDRLVAELAEARSTWGRAEVAKAEDLATLRRLWEQARDHIDAGTSHDRRPELQRLQRLRADLPMLRNIAAVNERQLADVEDTIARTGQSLADGREHLETLARRRRFRRPDQQAIHETSTRIQALERYVARLHQERGGWAERLDISRRQLRRAERAVARIPDVEAAIPHRSDWLLSHPAELAWEADLATRLA